MKQKTETTPKTLNIPGSQAADIADVAVSEFKNLTPLVAKEVGYSPI